MSGLFDVGRKTVVVTGGTRGIGLMIARGFAEAGARVIISSRKADACESRRRNCPESETWSRIPPTSVLPRGSPISPNS